MKLNHGPAVVLHEAFVSGWLRFHHTSHKVLKGRVEGAQHPAEQSIHCGGDVAHYRGSEAEPGPGPGAWCAKVCPSSGGCWSRRKLRSRSTQLTKPHSFLFVPIFPGKSNPYCEVTMGSQCHITKTIQDTLNPKWNSNCQFFIKDLEQDVLCITVFERDQFSPDDFLGRTEIRVADIKKDQGSKGPVTKCLLLHEVPTGEIVVRLDLQLFDEP
ncbi:hypothetical protein EK904_010817 [Melospiza melodia maxima]|nr:hypothetical protein EK904_010817 [Melospiza melodia maxima]